MAITLTEEEKLDIVKVLTTPGRMVTYTEVNDQIFYLGEANITAAVETDIRALITEWTANGTNRETGSIEPNVRNFGRRENAGELKNVIRTEMASLLSMTNLLFGGQGWARSTRG
jgi:hypothetical protein